MYYIRLLEILKDRDTLRLIAPKVRKANSIVINHAKVWEYLCTTYLRVFHLLTQLTLATERALADPP